MILRAPVVRERKRVINGREYVDWAAYCGRVGRRRFFFFAQTRELAKQRADSFLKEYRSAANPVLTVLNRKHAIDALNAMELLSAHRLDMSLSEIALEYLRLRAKEHAPRSGIALGALLDQHYAAIDPARHRTRSSYRSVIRLILRHIPRDTPAASLDPDAFRKLLKPFKNPRTHNSVLKRLKAVFNRAVAQKLLPASPAEPLEFRHEHYKEPAYFDADKVARIMHIVERERPANGEGMFFVLGFFAGIRSAEIHRARWEDIDLDEGYIRIPAPKGITNGGKPRLVELEPNAIAWIRHLWPQPSSNSKANESPKKPARGRVRTGDTCVAPDEISSAPPHAPKTPARGRVCTGDTQSGTAAVAPAAVVPATPHEKIMNYELCIMNSRLSASGPIIAKPALVGKWKKQHLEPLGLSWGNDKYHNVMRHTYATMHVAAFRNAASTSLNLGHGRSSEILEKHYKGLAKRSAAEKYWRIVPNVAWEQ